MQEDRQLTNVKCPDCGQVLRLCIEGELQSWIRVYVYCSKCQRKWHGSYTGTGSVD